MRVEVPPELRLRLLLLEQELATQKEKIKNLESVFRDLEGEIELNGPGEFDRKKRKVG